MLRPPVCPKCFSTLHYEHVKPGAPPCPACGDEHPAGLTFKDYQRAQAESNKTKCSRCGQAVHEPTKHLADPLCVACSGLAAPVVISDQSGNKWQIVASRRNRGMVDDWIEHLCIRVRYAPEEAWELAVCGRDLQHDEYDVSDERLPAGLEDQDRSVSAVDNVTLRPMTDDTSFDITDGNLEVMLAALEYLEWPSSAIEQVAEAVAAMRGLSRSADHANVRQIFTQVFFNENSICTLFERAWLKHKPASNGELATVRRA